MAEFHILTDNKLVKANPKLTALNVELAQVETEIENLIDTLSGASPTLLNYANSKIEGLDAKRQSLTKAIADTSAGAVSPEQIKSISGHPAVNLRFSLEISVSRLLFSERMAPVQLAQGRRRISAK